jgi:hypothetical protein
MKEIPLPEVKRTPGKDRGRVLLPVGARDGGEFRCTAQEWQAKFETYRREREIKERSYLRRFSPEHAVVHAARLGKRLIKLDGHRRGKMWTEGLTEGLPEGEFVKAIIYDCDTEEQVDQLYTHFDSQQAVENTSDKVAGALREHETTFSSPLLASRHFSSGLSLAQTAWGGTIKDTYKLMDEWLPELEMLDGCNPTQGRCQTPILAGLLLLLRVAEGGATEFVKRYIDEDGETRQGRRNAVQALIDYCKERVDKKQLWGQTWRTHIMRAIAAAYVQHKKGEWCQRGRGLKVMTPKQFTNWIDEARTRLRK